MTKLTHNDVKNIKELYSNLVKAELDDILNLAEPYIREIKRIKQQLKVDENFNIFTAIAEKYRHENLHSDLLKVILGNEKNNIGNRDMFSKFLNYIGISDDYKNEKEAFISDYDSIKFQREYPIAIPLKGKEDEYESGRIDLLIDTNDACIIIENKINGAPDQPNQLGKYYMHMAKTENKKVLKIVYLTKEQNIDLSSIFGKYNFNKYAPGYNDKNDIIQKINNLLITLPCVTMEKDKESFTKFLEAITPAKNEHDNTTDAKKVFIKQYKSLITSIGGQVLMSEPEKEFIRSFRDEKDKIWSAEKFKEIWEHRAGIISEFLIDDRESIYSEMEIAPDRTDICQKKITGKDITDEVYLYYASNNDEDNGYNIEFGFRPPVDGNLFKKDLANKLEKIFEPLDTISHFEFDPKVGLDPKKAQEIKWVYAHVCDLGNLTYEETKQQLHKCLIFLEKEARKALKSQKK